MNVDNWTFRNRAIIYVPCVLLTSFIVFHSHTRVYDSAQQQQQQFNRVFPSSKSSFRQLSLSLFFFSSIHKLYTLIMCRSLFFSFCHKMTSFFPFISSQHKRQNNIEEGGWLACVRERTKNAKLNRQNYLLYRRFSCSFFSSLSLSLCLALFSIYTIIYGLFFRSFHEICLNVWV